MLLLLHPLVTGEVPRDEETQAIQTPLQGPKSEKAPTQTSSTAHQAPMDEEAEAISTPHQVSKTEVAPAPTTSTLHQAPINKETQPKVIATPDQVPISEDNKPYIN